MRKAKIWVLLVGMAIGTMALSASLQMEILPRIDSFFETSFQNHLFSGDVLLSMNGKVVFHESYVSDGQHAERASNPALRFRIATLSCPFTATLVMLAQQQGLLSVQDAVSRFFPEVPAASQMCVQDLLQNTSGIGDYSLGKDFQQNVRDPVSGELDREMLLQAIQKQERRFAPGERFELSFSNYALLALILEQASGKRFEELLHEWILDPLHMDSTGLDHGGYDSSWAMGTLAGKSRMEFPMEALFGSAQMYSTTNDLYRFDRSLREGQLLPFSEQGQMYAVDPELFINDILGGYGFGWYVNNMQIGENVYPVVFQPGSVPGYTVAMMRVLVPDVTVIILCNNEGFDMYNAVTYVLEELLEPESQEGS
ncbi:MAG TPA: serine hydrolase domain-containing protein [Thermotogota bacterium]|nr:serine hydrolase domain-containing protein [Thermotogota bacterium]HRW93725.1 serine hydrolase domain-containing protein [Thermotogota bacterium]